MRPYNKCNASITKDYQLMANNLTKEEWQLLQQWLNDPTFVHWAEKTNELNEATWEEYFNQNPAKWYLAKIGRSLIVGVSFREISRTPQAGQKALAALLSRVDNDESIPRWQPRTVEKNYKHAWALAASITLLLILSAGIYWQFFFNPHVVVSTLYGQQLKTELPDGSVVTLNANSTLKYQKLHPRKVRLSGEAYFEVKKLPATGEDFRVTTDDLEITVLGTAFNVNTRNDHTKVFLAEGKVSLDVPDANGKEITMNPGDLVSYSRKKNELVDLVSDASALKLASWKEGALIFKDTPLTEALFQIEDIYGIQFIVQFEALKKELISGGVPIKNLDVTLSTLREVYGLKVEKRGRRFFIEGMIGNE